MQIDVTAFSVLSVLAEKVYLSPMIDCFDRLVVSCSIGTSSSTELVNDMLDEDISLPHEEHPIVHSDHGGYYRLGWMK